MPLTVKLYTGREKTKRCYRCRIRFLGGDEVVTMPGDRNGKARALVHVNCSPIASGHKRRHGESGK